MARGIYSQTVHDRIQITSQTAGGVSLANTGSPTNGSSTEAARHSRRYNRGPDTRAVKGKMPTKGDHDLGKNAAKGASVQSPAGRKPQEGIENERRGRES